MTKKEQQTKEKLRIHLLEWHADYTVDKQFRPMGADCSDLHQKLTNRIHNFYLKEFKNMTKKENIKRIMETFLWDSEISISDNRNLLKEQVLSALEEEPEQYTYLNSRDVDGRKRNNKKVKITSTPKAGKEFMKYMENLEKQLPPDETIIKKCLDYLSHRIRKHPESFPSKNWESWLPRIDELRKGKRSFKDFLEKFDTNSFIDGWEYGRGLKDKPNTFCGMPVSDKFYVEKPEKLSKLKFRTLESLENVEVDNWNYRLVEAVKLNRWLLNRFVNHLNNPSGE